MAYSKSLEYVTGIILPYINDIAPEGWLLCNGEAYWEHEYPDLYNVIGTRFGSLSKDFNVPDLRGNIIRGWDKIGGISANRDDGKDFRTAIKLGGSTGNNIGTYEEDEFKIHAHSVYKTGNQSFQTNPDIDVESRENSGSSTTESSSGVVNGGNVSSNQTNSKNLSINWIIKT